jgi:hypothetical protein
LFRTDLFFAWISSCRVDFQSSRSTAPVRARVTHVTSFAAGVADLTKYQAFARRRVDIWQRAWKTTTAEFRLAYAERIVAESWFGFITLVAVFTIRVTILHANAASLSASRRGDAVITGALVWHTVLIPCALGLIERVAIVAL